MTTELRQVEVSSGITWTVDQSGPTWDIYDQDGHAIYRTPPDRLLLSLCQVLLALHETRDQLEWKDEERAG